MINCTLKIFQNLDWKTEKLYIKFVLNYFRNLLSKSQNFAIQMIATSRESQASCVGWGFRRFRSFRDEFCCCFCHAATPGASSLPRGRLKRRKPLAVLSWFKVTHGIPSYQVNLPISWNNNQWFYHHFLKNFKILLKPFFKGFCAKDGLGRLSKVIHLLSYLLEEFP